MKKISVIGFLLLGTLVFSGCQSRGSELFSQAFKSTVPGKKGPEATVVSTAPVDSIFIDPYGYVLTTRAEKALYTNKEDTLTSSSCYGECALVWIPLLVDYKEEVSGEYTVLERTDGMLQVVYNGLPLYTYQPDQQKQITGDGSGGIWDVVILQPVE